MTVIEVGGKTIRHTGAPGEIVIEGGSMRRRRWMSPGRFRSRAWWTEKSITALELQDDGRLAIATSPKEPERPHRWSYNLDGRWQCEVCFSTIEHDDGRLPQPDSWRHLPCQWWVANVYPQRGE